MAIKGIKLITHNMDGVNNLDTPEYGPYLLTVVLRVPEFLKVANLMLFGHERIVVRGKTQEALEEFVRQNHFYGHSRLISCTIKKTHEEKDIY